MIFFNVPIAGARLQKGFGGPVAGGPLKADSTH
jgi:hypothetical protein